MNYLRFRLLFFFAGVCLAVSVADAGAQARSRGAGGGNTVGRAVPRQTVRSTRPIVMAPRVYGGARYRPYYYPYRPGVRVGIYAGFGHPYYGYPHFYGYPYGAYGYYPYGYPYPYSYSGYSGYGYAAPGYGYGYGSGYDYGGVRIHGAPRDAQVFVDGYYAGIVDDFDGPFQRLELEPGAHQIEIRGPGLPPLHYDVNIQPGQTLTIHVR